MSNILVAKPWNQFPELTEAISNGELLQKNLDDGLIYRIKTALLNGGTDSGDEWDDQTTYNTDEVVVNNYKFWQSLVDSNLDNPPVEGSYWTEVSKSTSNGFGRYAAGLFTINPTMVINSNKLYLLSSTVTLPFNSNDFDTELYEGKWVEVTPSTGLRHKFSSDTTDADPGSGYWKFSSSKDYIYINNSLLQSNGTIQNIYDRLTTGSTILIEVENYIYQYASITLTANAISATNYTKLPILVEYSDIGFSNNDICKFTVQQGDGLPTINDEDVEIINPLTILNIEAGDKQADFNAAVEEYVRSQDGGGFCSWDDDGAAKWSITGTSPTASFNVLQGGCGRILGRKVTFEAQSITPLPTAYAAYFVACDINGDISLQSNYDTDNYFTIFQIFVGFSTSYYVGKENHPFHFAQPISSYLHSTIGTIIAPVSGSIVNGGNIAIGTITTQIAISGAAVFSDHGLNSSIPDTAGAGVSLFTAYKNASSQWQIFANSVNVSPYYNSAGTPTVLASGKFVNYRIYASKDDGNVGSISRYIAIMGTVSHSNLSAAQTAINAGTVAQADGLLINAEIAQLGYATVNNAGQVVYVKVEKKTAVTGVSTGTSGLAAVAYDGLHTSLTGKNDEAAYMHVNTSTGKITPIDADSVALYDTVTSSVVKLSMTNLKAFLKPTISLPIMSAFGDEDTDIVAGTTKLTYRMPFAFTLTGIRANLKTAPTGSTAVFDVNQNGTSILSTKISIDSGEKTSVTAATPPVILTSALTDDAEITVDIDQAGATIKGTGPKLTLIGYRS